MLLEVSLWLGTHARSVARSLARMLTRSAIRTDAPETASRRDYIEKLKTRIVDEAAKIQALRESTAANSLQSKLNRCACTHARARSRTHARAHTRARSLARTPSHAGTQKRL